MLSREASLPNPWIRDLFFNSESRDLAGAFWASVLLFWGSSREGMRQNSAKMEPISDEMQDVSDEMQDVSDEVQDVSKEMHDVSGEMRQISEKMTQVSLRKFSDKSFRIKFYNYLCVLILCLICVLFVAIRTLF